MEPIEADVETTLPQQLRAALSAHASGIAAYQSERARIDRAAEGDVVLRIDRPANPHQHVWDTVLATAEQAVAGRRLVGFHAARLMADEIADIKANGLKVLSEDFLHRRLSKVEASGSMPALIIAALRASNLAAQTNRSGRTCFCFTRETFRDERAVHRLLRSWGGEAMYAHHERDLRIGSVLRKVGTPCIVVAAIPVEDIKTYVPIGECLVNMWCGKHNIRTEHAPGFEGHTRKDTGAANIVRVVEFGDAEFDALTGHRQWRDPLK
jgi:hypothetical protein